MAHRYPWQLTCLTPASSDSSPAIALSFESAAPQTYVFNVPEGTSRAANQSRINISAKRLGGIFISGARTEECGGLHGFLMQVCETHSGLSDGGKTVHIYGPQGTQHFIASGRLYTRRNALEVKARELPPPRDEASGGLTLVTEDENIAVYALSTAAVQPPAPSQKRPASPSSPPISRKRPRRASRSPSPTSAPAAASPPDAGDHLDWRSPSLKPSTLTGSAAAQWRSLVIRDMFRHRSDLDPRPGDKTPAWSHARLPSLDAGVAATRPAVSWLCLGRPQRGRFLPERAKALGVKPGPDFGKLSKGERVWVPTDPAGAAKEGEGQGRWVEPSDCMAGAEKAHGVFIATCPSLAHIPQLTAHAFHPHAQPLLQEVELKCVVHNCGPGVLADPAYAAWLASAFPPRVRHLVGSAAHTPDVPTFAPAALLSLRLSRLSRDHFPVPYHRLRPLLPPPPGTEPLHHGLTIGMAKAAEQGVHRGAEIRRWAFAAGTAAAEAEMARLWAREDPASKRKVAEKAWADYLGAVALVERELAEEAAQREHRGAAAGAAARNAYADDIVVTTLGTGSAVPSKYRNVSATLLQLPSGEAVLLDAGENTLGQLRRWCGSPDRVFDRLGLIFISHMHADHHAGLAALLMARRQSFVDRGSPLRPVVLVAPPGVFIYLSERHALDDLGLASVVCLSHDRCRAGTDPGDPLRVRAAGVLGDLELDAFEVSHAGRCSGVALRHRREGWKVVFSGDTRPEPNIIAHGDGCDLLIHEATIDDSMPEVAHAKGHSTVGQALAQALKMRARHVVLTHFSSRYPKLPKLRPATGGGGGDGDGSSGPPVALGFDLLSIRVGDLWKFRWYLQALEALFADGEPEEMAAVLAGADPDPDQGPALALAKATAAAAAAATTGKEKAGEGRRQGKQPRAEAKAGRRAAWDARQGTGRKRKEPATDSG